MFYAPVYSEQWSKFTLFPHPVLAQPWRAQILSNAKSILKVVFCHHMEALWVAALNKPCTHEESLLQNRNTDAREINTSFYSSTCF